MRRLLLGDFCRIIQKKSFWIVLFLYTVYMLVTIYGDYHGSEEDWIAPIDNVGTFCSGLSLLTGIVLMLGVYGDEFGSMTMICVIGRGTSRVKYVISKLLLCVIMMLTWLQEESTWLRLRPMPFPCLPLRNRFCFWRSRHTLSA